MIRKHKQFERPRKAFDIVRIKSENKIVTRYGLKNKKEIWKARAKLNRIRKRAKKLINADQGVQQEFVDKLNKLGFKIENVVDVLALTEEDILKRRLQSVLVEKKIATTHKGARQLITHKHTMIEGKIVNIPSYQVNTEEEKKIKLLQKNKKSKLIVEESNKNVPQKESDETKMEVVINA
ncbi:30S ribosomal protein S4 [Candidatus Pacearchaeota archaeon CG10_big_fil_rev_8_21_14_0_10_30_48]|nr:MAG: 30S ribosomal protein S4 [Candidatus Pacearchaeota archaeon CG10_big_fil_rev_8_21_14_0_10_30_48]